MLPPLEASKWTVAMSAHLLNRAGFGGTPNEIKTLHRMGLDGAVAWLVDGQGAPEAPPLDPPEWVGPDPKRAESRRQAMAASPDARQKLRQERQREERRRIEELRVWWLRRMVASPRPLEEKLLLFWHGHFATSIQKVRDANLMYRQLDLFRRSGFGRWADLLRDVTRDPAMLIWLDQARSRKEHPNENYAREVMELFALGEGHYSERDIQEAARALTGLTLNPETREPEWRPRQHDPGIKSVLGTTASMGPDEVISVIATQPTSARHVVGRLWRFFGAESASAPVIDGLAAKLQEKGGDIRSVLRCLFRSAAFYGPDVVRTQIKSPVQWLVSALRELERPLPPGPMATSVLRELGQDLFAPPNVKGWDGGVAWISTGTLTRRQQLGAILAEGRAAIVAQTEGERGMRMQEHFDRRSRSSEGQARNAGRYAALFSPSDWESREALASALARRFLHAPMRSSLRDALFEIMGDDPVPNPRVLPQALRAVLESTEYQLN